MACMPENSFSSADLLPAASLQDRLPQGSCLAGPGARLLESLPFFQAGDVASPPPCRSAHYGKAVQWVLEQVGFWPEEKLHGFGDGRRCSHTAGAQHFSAACATPFCSKWGEGKLEEKQNGPFSIPFQGLWL